MAHIPVLTANGQGVAEAWEHSVKQVYQHGCELTTMYDQTGDPPSKDATMMITVMDPLAEPRIHKDLQGGLETLQEYVMEVTEGIKDHLVRDPGEPDDARWAYTYHGRLFNFTVSGHEAGYDQMESMVHKLAESPYTRRAQAVTWKVWEDNECSDPACLQSIWCRLMPDGEEYFLNTNVRFRSNDAYKAAFMNMYALVELQRKIAARVGEMLGTEVKLGRYVHFADSYHIYGSDLDEFNRRFLRSLENRSFEQRTYRQEEVEDIMRDAKPAIYRKAQKLGSNRGDTRS